MVTDVSKPAEKRFILITWGIFILAAAWVVFHHELWRDEMQAWMIVRSSPHITDLYHNTRYEGHPLLWYVILWLLNQVTSLPESMQWVHLGIAGLIAFTWLKHAPFSRLQRALFLFGYFPLYEYTAICRDYSGGILFLILAVILFRKKENLVGSALLLFIAMQANMYALVLAISVSAGMLFFICFNKKEKRYPSGEIFFAALIILSGMAIAARCIYPPADQWFGGWRQDFSWKEVKAVFTIPARATLPVPYYGPHYWNTTLIPGIWLPVAISMALIIYCTLLFKKKPWILVIFLTGLTTMLSFSYLRLFGLIRHHGHFYILLIICLWLYYSGTNTVSATPFRQWMERWGKRLVTAIFLVNIMAVIIPVYHDTRLPFSRSGEAAEYIQANHLDTLPLAGVPDYVAASLSGYLGKPIYFPETDTTGTYIVWNTARSRSVTNATILERTKAYARRVQKDVLLSLNYEVRGDSTIRFIQSFPDCIEGADVFFLHIVTHR